MKVSLRNGGLRTKGDAWGDKRKVSTKAAMRRVYGQAKFVVARARVTLFTAANHLHTPLTRTQRPVLAVPFAKEDVCELLGGDGRTAGGDAKLATNFAGHRQEVVGTVALGWWSNSVHGDTTVSRIRSGQRVRGPRRFLVGVSASLTLCTSRDVQVLGLLRIHGC